MGIEYDPFGGDKTFLYSVLGVTALISVIGFFVSKAMLTNYGNDDEDTEGLGGNPVLDAEVSRSLHKAQMHLKRVRSSSADENVQDEAERLLQEVERVSKSVMKNLVITDTIAPTEAVISCPNIRVVPTAPMFAQAILNTWSGTSVSSLFDANALRPIYEGMYSA